MVQLIGAASHRSQEISSFFFEIEIGLKPVTIIITNTGRGPIFGGPIRPFDRAARPVRLDFFRISVTALNIEVCARQNHGLLIGFPFRPSKRIGGRSPSQYLAKESGVPWNSYQFREKRLGLYEHPSTKINHLWTERIASAILVVSNPWFM